MNQRWKIKDRKKAEPFRKADGRGTYKENRRFVRVARGSLNETRHWLRRAFRRGLLSEGQVAELRPLLDELSPKLNAFLNSIGRKGPKPTDN